MAGAQTEVPSLSPAAGGRLMSLDALRGFDMFWILGMEEFAGALGRANNATWAQFVARQLDHASWEGFHFLDLIFPLFVFISGASLVFSLSRSMEQRGRTGAARRLVVRCVLLYALGLLYYGGVSKGLEGVRWVGVLQRIAISGLVAGVLFCYLGVRARALVCVALLLGYWVWMSFVPVPGGVAGDFAEGPMHNWANWIDFHHLPGHRWDKTHDPEGLLSSIPAVATCLLGGFAGEYLRNHRHAPGRKAAVLIGAGALLAGAGWLWGLQFPVIKKLWTSSYVLVAGGYSLMLLGAFYWRIDVRCRRAWATPFVWIGMNAITLYLANKFLKIEDLAAGLVGGPIAEATGAYAEVVAAVAMVGINLLMAWFLYRRKIFLRV